MIKSKSNNRKWFIGAIIGAIIVAAVLAMSLIGLNGGEAADKLEKKAAQEKSLAEVKIIIPGADSTIEMPEYDSSNGFGFAVKNQEEDIVAVIVADRITGKIALLVDMREESYSNISGEVKIEAKEATRTAEGFFKSKGVDISEYGLEQDPLHVIAMDTSDMDNPKPIYQYDFNYRIQKDGVFIDDFNNGSGFCSIGISAEDGRVLSFILPRDSFGLDNKSIAEKKITKEKAIELAVDHAPISEERKQVPVLSNEDIEMRYMLDGNTLVPYWTVRVEIYEGSDQVSGVDISLSAVDGSVITEAYY